MTLIEVRLRPTTPWRVGHGGGDRERVDVVYHSDALYSAITHAMKTLGWLDEWLAATAQSETEPTVRFSSLFPFIGKTRLIAPPKTWWPPANPGRLYTEAAKLIPLEVVRSGIIDESRWMVDGETGCLFHTGSGAPVRIEVRTSAAIDRLTGVADPHRIACLEFAPNAGFWGVFSVDDSLWESRVKSAFRLLADSGFGGERSRGWGRAAAPEFSDAGSLLPTKVNDEGAWWLLSMYSPAASDAVDWSRGEYGATQRGGWTDSQSGVALKKQVRMLEEGSVLYAESLRGRAVDVAPDGFPHPVYRAGFAFAVPAPPEPTPRQPQKPEPAPPISPEPTTELEGEFEGEFEAELEAEIETEFLGTLPVSAPPPEPEINLKNRDCEGAAAQSPASPDPDAEAESIMESEGDPSAPTPTPDTETARSAAVVPDPDAEAESIMESEGDPSAPTPTPDTETARSAAVVPDPDAEAQSIMESEGDPSSPAEPETALKNRDCEGAAAQSSTPPNPDAEAQSIMESEGDPSMPAPTPEPETAQSASVEPDSDAEAQSTMESEGDPSALPTPAPTEEQS